ncbi:TetR/AcrR family transcriptional regulator [Saccharopolyspora cebuensis]|uniref:TetR/AcrR family transcriptional regulator n=1 Tax=Saccharopolyspora cebuensis TaxID=418759 RepID=A0ABV4CAC2_9PSEU
MSPKRADTGPAVPGAIWLRERAPGRGGGLTRERIAEATVALLDADGAAGLSLRRLAEALGVHATTLYWHVATRDDLLDLALDAVFGEIPEAGGPGADWTGDITGYMHGLRRALLRHPWSAALAGSRPLTGPNALARAESVHVALTGAGFRGAELSAAAAAISNLVIGSVAVETSWQHEGEAPARRAVDEHLRRHAERYPTLAAHAPTLDDAWDDHFDRAVRFLVDGLAAAR